MENKGKRTGWTKTELENEILSRMGALDTSNEEYGNNDILKDLKEIYKKGTRVSKKQGDVNMKDIDEEIVDVFRNRGWDILSIKCVDLKTSDGRLEWRIVVKPKGAKKGWRWGKGVKKI